VGLSQALIKLRRSAETPQFHPDSSKIAIQSSFLPTTGTYITREIGTLATIALQPLLCWIFL
jgi:hypothetical protein